MVDVPITHAALSALAAFLASTVEFVEALTVILAVGSVRGWRDAVLGGATALITLLLLLAVFGSALRQIPLGAIQLSVGTLLLLFGLRWLRKAILRSAGILPLHDEAAVFQQQTAALRAAAAARRWDRIAFGTAFQITMLEGTEVVFIVIAIGAGDSSLMLPASIGALVALACIAALGLAVHRPLSRVPENSLKFVVGVLLSAFGTFWFGEGIEVAWPGEDWSILALIGGYVAAACLAITLCRPRRPASRQTI